MLSLAHNASGYDNHYVLDGISDAFEINIISKTDKEFLAVDIKQKNRKKKEIGIRFLDSFNFISTSLANSANTLRKSNHPFNILKSEMNKITH